MPSSRRAVPFSLIRGGTSKCVVFDSKQVPPAGTEDLTRFLLAVMGSPDARQIDGLGGGTSLTSKVLIVDAEPKLLEGKPHVAFLFAQVGVDSDTVDYGGTCGNCTAAAAVYAVEQKIIPTTGNSATVPLYNLNTESVILAELRLEEDGSSATQGDERVAGVPGTGSPIRLWFDNPIGAVTGSLFPTGQRRQEVALGDASFTVSVLDVVNPVVFVSARALGATGGESAAEMMRLPRMVDRMRELREWGAVELGLARNVAEVPAVSPSVPKIAVFDGIDVRGDGVQVNVTAGTLSMGRPHAAFALSSAMCLAVAAGTDGTVVQEGLGRAFAEPGISGAVRSTLTRIHHPSGNLGAMIQYGPDGAPERIGVTRTARVLAGGEVYLRQ